MIDHFRGTGMDYRGGFSRAGRIALLSVWSIAVCANLQAAVVTVKVGVASPQTNSEIGNTEILRERATRNAMELALFEVKGTVLSSEQAATLRSADQVSIRNGSATSSAQQESRFRDNAVTRTEGHVRVLEILEEWTEEGRYHVKVKLEVTDQHEANEKLGPGFFWERIGKPGIALEMKESLNGRQAALDDPYTLRFFRDVMTKNALHTVSDPNRSHRYRIEITQETDVAAVPKFGTYAAQCRLSYRITDNQTGAALVEDRSRHGPQAGFSTDAARGDCLKRIAPQLSEKLVRALAEIFNDTWNEGDEFTVRIANLPASHMTDAVDAIEQVFRVKQGRMDSFEDGTLSVTVRYQGQSADLARSVGSAFEEMGHRLAPESVGSNVIGLRWLDSPIK